MRMLLAALDTRPARAVLLAAGVFGLFAAVTVANIALVSLSRPLPAKHPSAAPLAKRRPRVPRSLEDYRAIWETRTGGFSPHEPSGPEPTAEPPEPRRATLPAPDLSSRFEAIGVSTGSPGVSILRDQATGAQFALAVGDELPDGTGRLAKVEIDCVTLETSSGSVVLRLAGEPGDLSGREPIACPRADFLAAARWTEAGGTLRVADPCARGLEPGDRLVAVNGRRVEKIADLERAVSTGPTEILLLRDTRTVKVVVRIGA